MLHGYSIGDRGPVVLRLTGRGLSTYTGAIRACSPVGAPIEGPPATTQGRFYSTSAGRNDGPGGVCFFNSKHPTSEGNQAPNGQKAFHELDNLRNRNTKNKEWINKDLFRLLRHTEF